MVWQQVYDPLGSMFLSTLVASIPVVVMLVGLGFLHLKAHIAAGAGLLAAILIAVVAYGMPADMAAKATLLGGLTGLVPIGWIVLNIIFLHQLTEQNGSFKILQDSIAGITADRRLQLLLIAFAFGAFFEGAAGFGTPVAVTAAILIGLGFSPLAASGLSLIANTAPVAFGALVTPIITLAKVHGYDVGRIGDGWSSAPPVLTDCSFLASLGLRRPPGHDAGLARHPGHGHQLRHSTISRFELHRPGTGGRHRRHVVDDLSGTVPARLETQADVDLGVAQWA